ncbi:TIGR04255 family protein [uncultured Nocardioides sp.]|uniref:TIGR04255 family protein n=1 Tax=uncultured Nocardioides sp. TaxID=198441 RepID=UPI000C3DE8FD|nr:hypothetical protein [Nocardioides sp.]MCK5928491.1 TIGR04255 family protein [Nocardioides sp.]|tara:strand:- start:2236 stop:2970 length:735 start_codon:yes stop_codon:yes gene_type:complete
MQIGRRYGRAPIAEAIIEFRVARPRDLGVEQLVDVGGAEFATGKPMYRVNGQTVIEDDATEPVSTVSTEQIGLSFEREDSQRLILATLDSFAFIWRGQYDHWDTFVAEVEQAWLRYRGAVRVSMIEGIGVRFVNHIAVPQPAIEVQDYLRTTIHLAPQLPQTMTNMFMQATIPFDEEGCEVTITSGPLPGQVLLLDIDARSNVLLSTSDPDFDERLLESLTTLRRTKNFVFEACITDATRSLID